MDNEQYNYIIKILRENIINGENYIEKGKINQIRKLYSMETNKEKTILYKKIKDKKRIVISFDDMDTTFHKYHDDNNHNSKTSLLELLKDYYWDTKQMDLEYYLSKCTLCGDKYQISVGKDKKKKRLELLKTQKSKKLEKSISKVNSKKRKYEDESSTDYDSVFDCESFSGGESDLDDVDSELLTSKPPTKKNVTTSPPKPIQNIFPKKPPMNKISNSKLSDDDDDDDNDNYEGDEKTKSLNKKRKDNKRKEFKL
ncbi:hypothetical protein RB653_005901 [Dictyostelium firmibasis]|uniref:Uncharacterized protein n=1 Tax=Dictyostelium firmibasis TaxID=79012 RepID=A0AAN7UC98_9MYCE